MRRPSFGILGVVVAVFAAVALGLWGASGVAPEAKTAPKSSGVHTQKRPIGFRTRADLVAHFRKHGREFGSITIEQYLTRAQALRDRKTGGPVLEIVRGDGVVTRFDRGGGAFLAFEKSGVIRTFFRPRDGERYFRRQAVRYGGDR